MHHASETNKAHLLGISHKCYNLLSVRVQVRRLSLAEGGNIYTEWSHGAI